MGLSFALILSGPLHQQSSRRRLEGLVVCLVEAECCFRLDPCLNTGVKGEKVFTLVYCSIYLWTQSGPEEDVLVIIGNASTLAGSDSMGAK